MGFVSLVTRARSNGTGGRLAELYALGLHSRETRFFRDWRIQKHRQAGYKLGIWRVSEVIPVQNLNLSLPPR